MCGIFAFIGLINRKELSETIPIILNGLEDLGYRGYENTGLYLKTNESEFKTFKVLGDFTGIKPLLERYEDSKVKVYPFWLGHSRWGTSGDKSPGNAHPHCYKDEFHVVHNGIVNDFNKKKELLETSGYTFTTDVDTELLAYYAHFFYKKDKKKSLGEIVYNISHDCDEQTTFVMSSKHFPNQIGFYKSELSLYIGLVTEKDISRSTFPVYKNFEISSDCNGMSKISDEEFEFVISSDKRAISGLTKYYIHLEDGDIGHINKNGLSLYNLTNIQGKENFRKIEKIEGDFEKADKGIYETYLEKEIHDQASAIKDSVTKRIHPDSLNIELNGFDNEVINRITKSGRIVIIGCGTSYNSGLAVRDVLEEFIGIPVAVEIASDFSDRKNTVILESDTYIFISQSGETADTLAALKRVKTVSKNILCIGVVNVQHSNLFRSTDYCIPVKAGLETSVASTKAYTLQCVALILFSLKIGQERKIKLERINAIINGLQQLPGLVEKVFEMKEKIEELVKRRLKDCENLIVVGRGYQAANCIEGALKIKELSYIPADGVLGGELKHGPLAQIDSDKRLILFFPNDYNMAEIEKTYSQIKSKEGKPIVITTKSLEKKFQGLEVICVPEIIDCLQGIINVIPVQFISLYFAKEKGKNIDMPRNLAKSVTTK